MRKALLPVLPIVLLLLALSACTSLYVLEAIPHTQDEVVYLFQAKIFNSGNLYLPSLPVGIRRFFDHEFIINNGKWYGKYTPGGSIFLMAPLAVNLPWLTNAIFGALSALLLYLIGRRAFSQRAGLLAAALFAVSPFTILISASFFSHPAALFFTLLVFLGVLSLDLSRYTRRNNCWNVIIGLSAGLVFMCRPYNLIPLAAVLLGYYAPRLLPPKSSEERRLWLAELACLALPLVGVIAAELAYNKVLTGSFLKFAQQVYSQYDFIGFGYRGVEWGQPFTTKMAMDNLGFNYRALKGVLFGWTDFYAVGLGALLLLTRRRWLALFLLGFFAAQVGAYWFYFYSGVFYGPRYWYEASWVLVLLTAAGAVTLLGWVERWIGRRAGSVIFTLGLVAIVLLSLNWDRRYLPIYRGVNRMYRVALPPLRKPALVFVPATADWQAYGRYFILQSPILAEDDIIFARDQALHNVWRYRPPLPDQLLIDYLPGRNVYYLR